MSTIATESIILEKTRELCEAILNAPEYKLVRGNVDRFMGDEKAKAHYQRVVEKGDSLNHKQQQGQRLTPAEISDFETDRDGLLNNPVASEFISAQEDLHKIQEQVVGYVKKTLELGRLPNEDEVSGGGCGHGCGCSH
ncbi:MAG TPA: YlbF family regulator [Methylomirabilota bacterium]|nr:YlbF family regulator [Methylomirabilota bacterium]